MPPRPSDTLPAALLQRLTDAREALLHVHKALLDAERVRYERVRGPIENSNHYLQLVIGDPWFSWLRPLSQLVVAIDEFTTSRDPVTSEDANALLARARALLSPADGAAGFAGEFHRVLQTQPAVVRLHTTAWTIVTAG